jgi:cardiolipin synthase
MLGFFICFVLFVFFTRGRRPISNILAWLFFIFLVPYVGIPLFLTIGQRKLGWLLVKKRLMFNKQRDQLKKDKDNPLEHLLEALGTLPTTYNNSVQLLADGVAAYNCMIEHIQSAKESILISTYRLGKDEVGAAIVNLLIEKAKSGVQVCLLLDTIGSLFMFPRRKLKPLRKAGGAVRYIMPLLHTPFRGRVNLRDHRKIMIIDAHSAIVGGMNLAKEYIGPTVYKKRWTDLSLLISGDAVADLISVFESDWKFAASRMEHKSYQRPVLQQIQTGNAVIQMVASGPDTIGDVLYDAVISSIYDAQQSITIITPYFVLDDGLQKAFMIAIRRGVRLNIIIPRKSNQHMADRVRAISLRKLHQEGAHIYFYKKMIHAKCFIFDEKLVITGSANLDLRSLLLNFEISCFLYSRDEVLKIKAWADSLLNDCSTNFKKPTIGRMLVEDAAQLIKPLL